MTKAHTKCCFLIFNKEHNYQKTDKSKHYSEDNAIVTSRPELYVNLIQKFCGKCLKQKFECLLMLCSRVYCRTWKHNFDTKIEGKQL